MKMLASVLVLLSVVGVGRAGEKDVIERLEKAGAEVNIDRHLFGETTALWMRFTGDSFTDSALTELCELRQLRVLILRETAITDSGLRSLGGLTRLKALYVESCSITDAGLKELTELAALHSLGLENCPYITDAGIDHLAGMKGLRVLELAGTGVTRDGVARLQKALPTCKISH